MPLSLNERHIYACTHHRSLWGQSKYMNRVMTEQQPHKLWVWLVLSQRKKKKQAKVILWKWPTGRYPEHSFLLYITPSSRSHTLQKVRLRLLQSDLDNFGIHVEFSEAFRMLNVLYLCVLYENPNKKFGVCNFKSLPAILRNHALEDKYYGNRWRYQKFVKLALHMLYYFLGLQDQSQKDGHADMARWTNLFILIKNI